MWQGLFADDYAIMFGYKPTVVQGKGQAGDIVLTLRPDKKLGKEGYAVKIADRLTLSAPESVRRLLGHTHTAPNSRAKQKPIVS